MNGLSAETIVWIWVLGLFVLGFILIVLDIFVTPGFDLVGVLGLVSVCAGIAYAYVELGAESARLAAILGLGSLATMAWLAYRHSPWQRLVLESRIGQSQSCDPVASASTVVAGQTGRTLTALRPSGRAQFGDTTADVVTEGDFIDKATEITVVRVAGH
ncbi:NfeD family protein [Candidatus Latescibacterota bacterium]